MKTTGFTLPKLENPMREHPHDYMRFLQERSSEQHEESEEVLARSGIIADLVLIMNRRLNVYLATTQVAVAEKTALSVTELKALEIVQEFGALATGQLAQLMRISWGGATALINRLETAGYVKRGRHPLDRRIIVIRPVQEKCQELNQIWQSSMNEASFTVHQFDTQALRATQSFLTQYIHALRRDTQAWLHARPGLEA